MTPICRSIKHDLPDVGELVVTGPQAMYYVAMGDSPMDYRDNESRYVCGVEDSGEEAVFHFEIWGTSGGQLMFTLMVVDNMLNPTSFGWYDCTLCRLI